MSQQPETASVVRLSSITPRLVPRKVRIAGRLILYDAKSSLLLVADGGNALFVNASLCLNPRCSYSWLSESNTIVCALGYLEQLTDPIPIPTIPYHAPAISVDPYLVLSALLMDEKPDLDLDLWNSIAEKMERHLNIVSNRS